jgi:hypothetical protein
MAYSLSRNERLYLQMQTAFGTIPNTSGAATVAGSNNCKFQKMTLKNDISVITRPDKTGFRTSPLGSQGRGGGSWTIDMTFAANGTQGTVPDSDPILQSLFGGASTTFTSTITVSSYGTGGSLTATSHGLTIGTFVPLWLSVGVGSMTGLLANGCYIVYVIDANTLQIVGGSGMQGATLPAGPFSGAALNFTQNAVKYTLQEPAVNPTFVAWSFRKPSTVNQRCAVGCVTTSATWQLGADILSVNFAGDDQIYVDSDYAGLDPFGGSHGLSAMPTEPSTQTTNGNAVIGFTGSLVAGAAGVNPAGLAMVNVLRTATIKIGSGMTVVKDLFGSFLGDSTEGDVRMITVAFSAYDSDDTLSASFRKACESKVPWDVVLQSGTVKGSTVVWVLHNVQFSAYELQDGQRRFVLNVAESRAFGSVNPTSPDEAVMYIC